MKARKTFEKKPVKKNKIEYIFHTFCGFMFGKTRLHIGSRALYLLKCMDGETTDEEIIQKFNNVFSIKLTKAYFKKFIRQFKEHNLLDNKLSGCLRSKFSANFRKEQEKIFKRRKVREPTYAGMSYSGDPQKLKKDLQLCFSSVDTGKINSFSEEAGRIKGVIVPHSNIELSGSCAAWAYKTIATMPTPELVIILAPDHSITLKNPFSLLLKDMRTPLGLVRVDRDFCRTLAKKCRFDIFADSLTHIEEHSIEIQLPFLQYIYSRNIEKLRIVPIICSERWPWSSVPESIFDLNQKEFIQAIQKTVRESKKSAVFVATGDLIHSYKWNPTNEFHKKNKQIISLLEKGNVEDFRSIITPREYISCGRTSFYPFLKILGPAKSKVLNYSWTSKSEFINKDKKNIQYEWLVNIGYVSMAFY